MSIAIMDARTAAPADGAALARRLRSVRRKGQTAALLLPWQEIEVEPPGNTRHEYGLDGIADLAGDALADNSCVLVD